MLRSNQLSYITEGGNYNEIRGIRSNLTHRTGLRSLNFACPLGDAPAGGTSSDDRTVRPWWQSSTAHSAILANSGSPNWMPSKVRKNCHIIIKIIFIIYFLLKFSFNQKCNHHPDLRAWGPIPRDLDRVSRQRRINHKPQANNHLT